MEQNTQNTALLVMDMEAGILANFSGAPALVDNVANAISNARNKKMAVLYVVVGFRPGLPEVSPNNKSFAASKERFAQISPEAFMKINEKLTPAEGEVVIVKRRFSAFTGSDLEVVLRASGIQHLVLTGVSTSGVVLSTLREAADKDYRLTVLSDGCGDADEEVHRVLTTKVFLRQADVITVEEWSKG